MNKFQGIVLWMIWWRQGIVVAFSCFFLDAEKKWHIRNSILVFIFNYSDVVQPDYQWISSRRFHLHDLTSVYPHSVGRGEKLWNALINTKTSSEADPGNFRKVIPVDGNVILLLDKILGTSWFSKYQGGGGELQLQSFILTIPNHEVSISVESHMLDKNTHPTFTCCTQPSQAGAEDVLCLALSNTRMWSACLDVWGSH